MAQQKDAGEFTAPRIAVIIPAYRVKKQLEDVVLRACKVAWRVYVVDDACPECGQLFFEQLAAENVVVLRHDCNLGVGAATLTGMLAARKDGADILVKCDGDGQHPPELIPNLVAPIIAGLADYCKGNRFYSPQGLEHMPRVRLAGNAALSFLTKLSSGYWDVFDPTNGFIALHSIVLDELQIEKLNPRYFFESDMLFRLNLVGACVREIPMPSVYAEETSSLNPIKSIVPFLKNHTRNTVKRIIYSYFLRNFSMGSVFLLTGLLFVGLSLLLAGVTWLDYHGAGAGAPTGKVVLPAMLFITGVQFLIGFFSIDVTSVPRQPIYPTLRNIHKHTSQ